MGPPDHSNRDMNSLYPTPRSPGRPVVQNTDRIDRAKKPSSSDSSQHKPSFRLTDLPWDCQRLVVIQSLLRPHPIAIVPETFEKNEIARQFPPLGQSSRTFKPHLEPNKWSPLNLAATCRDYWALRDCFYSHNTFTGRSELYYSHVWDHRQAIGARYADQMSRWAWQPCRYCSLDVSPCWITHLTLQVDAASPEAVPEADSLRRLPYMEWIPMVMAAVSWRRELRELTVEFKRGERFENLRVEDRSYKEILKAASMIQDSQGIKHERDMGVSGAAAYALEYLAWGSCSRNYLSLNEEEDFNKELSEIDNFFLEDAIRVTETLVHGFNQWLEMRLGNLDPRVPKRREKALLSSERMERWRFPKWPRAMAEQLLENELEKLSRRSRRMVRVRQMLSQGNRSIRFIEAASESHNWTDLVTEEGFQFPPRMSKVFRRAEEDIGVAVGMLAWGLVVQTLFSSQPIWGQNRSFESETLRLVVAGSTAYRCCKVALCPSTRGSKGDSGLEERLKALLSSPMFNLMYILLAWGLFLFESHSSNTTMASFEYISVAISLLTSVGSRILVHMVVVSGLASFVTRRNKTPLLRTNIVYMRWIEVLAIPIVMCVMEKLIPGFVLVRDCTIISVLVLTVLLVSHVFETATDLLQMPWSASS